MAIVTSVPQILRPYSIAKEVSGPVQAGFMKERTREARVRGAHVSRPSANPFLIHPWVFQRILNKKNIFFGYRVLLKGT